jgi:hypothetical protein
VATADDSELLREVETVLGVTFPADYGEFIVAGAEAEGDVGESYLALYRLEELVSRNRTYDMAASHPGLVLIGSDGGGEAIGFDFHDSPPPIVLVSFVSSGWDGAAVQSDSFTEFITRLRSGKGYTFEG